MRVAGGRRDFIGQSQSDTNQSRTSASKLSDLLMTLRRQGVGIPVFDITALSVEHTESVVYDLIPAVPLRVCGFSGRCCAYGSWRNVLMCHF